MRQKTVIFSIGAAGYSAIELVYRGHTHWSMSLLGGTSLLTLVYIHKRFPRLSSLFKSLMGMTAITTAEFAVGILVNLRLRWNIWDYSGMSGNILGQICPQFCLCWYALSSMVFSVLKRLDAKKVV